MRPVFPGDWIGRIIVATQGKGQICVEIGLRVADLSSWNVTPMKLVSLLNILLARWMASVSP